MKTALESSKPKSKSPLASHDKYALCPPDLLKKVTEISRRDAISPAKTASGSSTGKLKIPPTFDVDTFLNSQAGIDILPGRRRSSRHLHPERRCKALGGQ